MIYIYIYILIIIKTMTFYLRALAGSLLPPHGAVREGSVTVGASRQGVLEASLKAREEAQ